MTHPYHATRRTAPAPGRGGQHCNSITRTDVTSIGAFLNKQYCALLPGQCSGRAGRKLRQGILTGLL